MKLKHLYTALGLLMLLPSCRDEEPLPPSQGQGLAVLPVSFTIQLAVEGQQTRDGDTTPGIWNEGEGKEQVGTDFDNTINTITPVLYYYSGSSKAIHEADPVATLIGGGAISFANPGTATFEKEYKKDTSGNYVLDDNQQKIFEGEYVVKTDMTCSYATRDMLLNGDNFRLAVFVNCSSSDIHAGLNVKNPKDAVFFHHGQPDAIQDNDVNCQHFHGIPMYGVKDVKFVETTEAGSDEKVMKIQEVGGGDLSIPVLRSMAKVRVKLKTDANGNLDEKVKDVKLKQLYIDRHAVKGYVVPKGWDTQNNMQTWAANGKAMNPFFVAGATDASQSNNYDHGCTVEPQDPEKDTTVNQDKHGTTGDYWANTDELLRFYLPDTYNSWNDQNDQSNEIYLKLTYSVKSGSEEKEYSHLLWFRPKAEWPEEYPDGVEIGAGGEPTAYPKKPGDKGAVAPWDIIRNHIYEFVIEGVEATTGALTVNVKVNEWTKHDMGVIYY